MGSTRVPRTTLGLTWREHIGGRWAISVRGFLLLLPILIISPLANIQAVTLRNVGLWLAASLITLAPLVLTWWLASITVLRHRCQQPVHVAVVVVVGFVSGAVRSGVMTWVTVEFDLFTTQVAYEQLIAIRMLIGGLQGAVGLPIVAMLLSVISAYRTERARLLRQAAVIAQQQDHERGAANALRDALAGPVRLRLQELADRLEGNTTSIDAVAGDVRQQAHTMWSEATSTPPPPSVRWSQVVRAAMRNRPLPVGAVWLLWFPSAFLTFALRETLLVAFVQVVVGSMILSAIYVVGTAVVHRIPNAGAAVFIAGTVSGGIISGYVVWLLSGAPNWDSDAVLYLTSIPWLAAVTLVVSIVESAVARSSQVLTEIRDGIQDSEVALLEEQRVRSDLANEVASVLHGVVQGRLAIAQRADFDSTALARQALDDGIERLSGPIVLASSSAREIAEHVSAPWGALMDIRIHASEGDLSSGQVRDVSDVLEECLSNAFRHGGASEVVIQIHRSESGWRLEVGSDGSSPTDRSLPGMGSGLFDSVSGGNWSRKAVAQGGCLVTVNIPAD